MRAVTFRTVSLHWAKLSDESTRQGGHRLSIVPRTILTLEKRMTPERYISARFLAAPACLRRARAARRGACWRSRGA